MILYMYRPASMYTTGAPGQQTDKPNSAHGCNATCARLRLKVRANENVDACCYFLLANQKSLKASNQNKPIEMNQSEQTNQN